MAEKSIEERIISLETEMMKMKNKDETVKKRKKVSNVFKKEPWHTTLYDLEYCPKTVKKQKTFKPFDEHEHDGDPIAYAYKNNLKSSFELDKVKDKCAYENADCFYYKLLQKKPSITKVVDTPVKQDVIKEVHLDTGRSLYQLDYCKRLERSGGLAPLIEKTLEFQEIDIPEKWLPLPLTEYRSSYKDHRGIAPWNLTPKLAVPPKGELTLSEREKQMKKDIGETEYKGVICNLGSRIIKDEYHGKVPLLPYELILPQEEEEDLYKTFSII